MGGRVSPDIQSGLLSSKPSSNAGVVKDSPISLKGRTAELFEEMGVADEPIPRDPGEDATVAAEIASSSLGGEGGDGLIRDVGGEKASRPAEKRGRRRSRAKKGRGGMFG